MKKVKYNQMAVLTRVYRQMPLIEATLIRHDIPYSSREGLLLNRPEVKTVIAGMRYLLTGKETKGLDLNRIDMLRSDLFPGIQELLLEDAFNIGGCFLLSRTPESLIEDEQSLTQIYLDALETIISRHEDFPGLMKSIESIVSSQKKDDGVQLLTIHQAKGLEFTAAIVPGVNEGTLPHVHSLETLSGIEEERRLMYVAITRAGKHLTLTYRKRHQGRTVAPSRFIKEMKLIP